MTDDTAAIQAGENVRTAGQTLKFTPGKTYVVDAAYAGGTGSTAAQALLRVNSAGTWDATGATLKYGSAYILDQGTDSNAYAVINVLSSDVTFLGTIDCNSLAKFAVGLKDTLTGFRFDATFKGVYEPGLWTGMAWALSVDITGVSVTTRAVAVAGTLHRPSCPYVDYTDTIATHGDVVATIVGGFNQLGNGTGVALVPGPHGTGSENSLLVVRPDIKGIPNNAIAGDHNLHFLDIGVHDLGADVIELYGTSATNSAGYGMLNNDTLGLITKYGTAWVLSHANLGSDSSKPSCVFIARAQGQAEIDFDYSGDANSGGRIVEKMFTLTISAGTISTDCKTATQFKVTLNANAMMNAPTNPRKGQRITYTILQDATGGRTLGWNSLFKRAWSDTGNTANKRSTISFVYDGTNWSQVSAQSPYV